MKSYIVHYKNKYPNGHVKASNSSIDIYDYEGKHRVSLVKNGHGQWADQSEEMGCLDRHDLAPLPQNACAVKLFKNGKIGKDEKHDERADAAARMADHDCGGEGKVPSCEEIKAAGYELSAGSKPSARVWEPKEK